MNAVGIILAGGKNERLGVLTKYRATSAMPIGSCYRAIDFPLSNMTNSGISKVAVMTQYNSRSLHDHLSSSKWWDLGRKQGGLFVLSPFLANDNSLHFRGTADSIYQNLTFLRRSKEKYVVISSGDCVYKMDYNDILKFHRKEGADITIAYCKVPAHENIRLYGVMELDEQGRLIDMEEKPLDPQSDIASIGVYVIARELLISLIEELGSQERHDLVRDLFSRYRKRLKICGYHFDGFWRNIGNIRSYYNCNMDFLDKNVRDSFILNAPHIHTKPKDEPPAKFNSAAGITNCLVGSGAILDGDAHSSIVFRNVRIGEHSDVRNSILMESTKVGRNCTIEYAILDKEVIVKDGAKIVGTPESPMVVAKGTVVNPS
ncbi:MAG: glucose-1-phosphate adenylyltransferase subunit GlgD [Firmicutes bacterium]|nr:glucose-1-phosphate adenylyltransferase subunit GlgD [Bacillota bacterium]